MRLARHVRFREEKFGGVLFETRAEKVFTLNPAAAAIVREIRGGGSQEQVTSRLLRRFRDPAGIVVQQAGEFIAELRNKGLVEDSPDELATGTAPATR